MFLVTGKTAAYVRHGALIVEFGNSSQAAVWRYDLDKVHAVIFRTQQDGASATIGVEGPKGEFAPVASYPSAERADRAIVAIRKALRHQEGDKQAWSMVAWLLSIMLLVLTLFLASAAARNLLFTTGMGEQAASAIPSGKPMTADQALQAPQ